MVETETAVAQIQRFYTSDGALRIAAMNSTELVRGMVQRLTLSPLATLGLGRLATGAVLMASHLAEGQSLSIRITGDGPIGHLCAEASFEAKVRAYCQHPQVDLPLTRKGHLDLSTAVGAGYVSVAHTLPFQKEPRIGITEILSGEIGEDLAFYLQQSQQVPSVVSLAVPMDRDGQVVAAGGVVIEVMPGTSKTVLAEIEAKAKTASALSLLLINGKSMEEIVRGYIHKTELVAHTHPFEAEYFCPCSLERVERTLKLMGKEGLGDLIARGEEIRVNCEFCQELYTVSVDRARELLLDVADSPEN